jgi:antiviral helicase SKI2
MAGRAGRRGLDAVGTVLLPAWGDLPDEGDIRRLLTGAGRLLWARRASTSNPAALLRRVLGSPGLVLT